MTEYAIAYIWECVPYVCAILIGLVGGYMIGSNERKTEVQKHLIDSTFDYLRGISHDENI